MKIKVLGSEISDANIEYVSLVKRGANRTPIKILKAEDMKGGSLVNSDSLTERVASMFGKNTSMPKVSAVFVPEDRAEAYKDFIEKSGFSVDSPEVADGVIMYKQDCYDPEKGIGSLIAINKEVGIGMDSVVKSFTSYPMSDDFNENVQAASFYPGLHNAVDALYDTLWVQLDKADDPAEAAVKIKETMSAFSKFVVALASNLPGTVFKLDKELRCEFDKVTVSEINFTKSDDKGGAMNRNAGNKEAVAGDLDGLDLNEPVVKSGEGAPSPAEGSTNTAAEDTSTTPEVKKGVRKVKKGDTIVDAEYQYEVDAEGNEIFLGWIEKEDTSTGDSGAEGDTTASDKDKKAAAPTGEADESVAKGEDITLDAIKEVVSAVVAPLTERLEKVEIKSDEAITKADNTVMRSHSDEDINDSFTHLNRKRGEVSKAETSEDHWGGILPDFDRISS